MPQALPLPDGSFVTIREGETPQDTWARAQKMYPDAFKAKAPEAQPESGFIAGVKSGIAGLKGDVAALAGRTGLMDEAAAEKYIKEQEAYRKSTYKEPETWGEAPVTKALGLLGQSVPYMAAPVVAGFAPGAAGLGLAGLASAAQFTGSNLSRQMGEGKKLGETELGAAAAASVPQAALDILSLKMLPGIRGIFSAAGKEVPEKVLLEATKQSTAKIAQDYALATGKAMGVEGLTEAGQQVFERLQAGLNITDAKARDEYLDSFIGGAVLGGAIAPVGRYVERGREQAQQQQARLGEIQKLRVQEEQQLEEDRAFRESPEGMAQTVAQYDALAQQRLALQAQLVKVKKDSPTYEADKAQNKEINAQINELSKQIGPLATDYHKAKKVLAAAEKQAALEAMPVEDFMLQELGMEVKPVAQKQVAAPVIRRGKGQLFGVEETPPVKDTSLQDYAAGQFDAARQVGVFDLGDAADYMMQDPAKAAQLVQTRTQVPGLNAKDNSTLLSGVKLRLDALEKSKLAASKEELAQRETTLKAQETTTTKDPLALYKESLGQIDELRATGESNFDFLDPVFEKAVEGKPPAVKVNENLQPLRDAKVAQKVRSTVEGLMTQIREADRDYANAKRGGDMAVADKAYQRGNRLLEQLKTMSEEIPAGELTKGLKTGPAKPDTRATYAKELFTTRNAQEEALGTAEDAIQRLRQGEALGKETQLVKDPETGEMRREAVPYGKGVAASTNQSLIKKAEDARAAYITAVLQEAAVHRRAAGKKALDVDEAVKAASELYDTFNEWIARVQKAPRRDTYESVMVEPAQMRANKLVRQARYEQRKVADERPVGEYPLGAYDQAVEVFKEQLDAVRNKLSELPSEALRETSLIKTQFAGEEAKKVAEAKGETTKTLSGELRRMSEYVSNKLDKALERDISTPGLKGMLEEAQDIIASGKVSRAFLDTVNNQAERIISGRLSGTKTVYRKDPKQRGRSVAITEATETDQNMQELKDALSLAKQTAGEGEVSGQGAAGQQQLFPETKEDLGYIRATPANFAKSPRMKPVWDALEKARDLAKKKTAKEQADMGRLNRAVATLDRIKSGIESLQKSTQFFWTDVSKWDATTLAKVFVKRTEFTGTPAQQEAAYKAKLAEALNMLSQQQRLYDADNQLLQFMQDTNAKIRTQAKELSERLAPMKRAIKDIQSTLRKSPVLTEAQKQSMNAEAAMREQRNAYQNAVEQAMVKAQKEMRAALAELLDPYIATVEADLQKAKQTLATETAELDRINAKYKNLETVLTDRARKFLIAEGEKQSKILDDLKTQIKAMETDLQDQFETRNDELDGAQVAARAMLDRNVKDERNYLEMLEGQLALVRGETITPKSKAYPFTAQKLENQIKTQKEAVRTAERRQEAFVEQEKSDQEKLENFWKDKFNGEGVRVVRRDPHKSQEKALAKIDRQIAEQEEKNAELREKLIGARLDKGSTALTKTLYGPKQNKALADGQRRIEELTEQRRGVLAQVTPLITTEQKEADKNRSIALQALDKQVDADARLSAKERLIEELDSDIFEQRSNAASLLGPDNKEQLADIAADPKTSKIARAEALLKIDVLNQIDVLEARKESYLTPKPFKEPKPATVPSTTALAAAKALRIGNVSVEELNREELRAANEQAKNIRGTKAPKLPEPSTRRQGRTPDQDLGLFEEEVVSRVTSIKGVFRTSVQAGPGMQSQQVKRLVDRILSDWAITPEVSVVENESELPQRIQDQAAKDGVTGRIPGVYDPNTKTVYLVASNLHTGNDVALTIAHEVAGHFGLREMLGGTYAKTMNSLYDGNDTVRREADAKMGANKNLSREVAVEEVLADMAETGAEPTANSRSALRRLFEAIKQWFNTKFGSKGITDNDVRQIVANARKYVQKGVGAQGGEAATGELVYRSASYTNPGIAKESEFASRIVSNNRSWWDKIKANASGLAFETQLVDRFAGFERLAKYMDPLKGSQMLFYLRMYDQRMNFVSQSVANGAPQIVEKTRADGRKEYLLETKESANIRNVVEILKEANPLVGNGEAVNMQFTLYMAAIRAQNKGLASLNFGKDVTQAKLDAAMAAIKATPGLEAIFKRAKTEYNTYNRNLLNFVASTGALSKDLVDKLVKEDDYIPFYRVRNGVAELLIGREPPIRIGSVAEQPHLENLVGGDEAILDFMTSSVQNTNMLVDMGMRNLATKNAVHELVNLKAATFVRKAAGANVVQFKVDGEDRYAIINSEKVTIGGQTFDTGVPGDVLVKGMEGIPTQMPFLFRALAMPSQLLRKAVVLSPLYMGRQLFRDSLAAPIMAGANFTPVLGALRQIGSPTKGVLEKRGITGGQQFTGTTDDLSQILRNISSGKPGWMQALGKFEAMGMEADALTRRAQYNSYIEQGLSEMEATLMALESMNFNKRGASPSIHVANALIPFFNAQIQGLNVMYKAMRGKLPFSDKLKIQEKMLMRGGMMAGVTLLYAAMMEDDEAYQNATPDQKYSNWFVRVPGLDEPVRVPIPFEIGYIFKALPEAVYNSMRSKQGQEDAVDAFATILRQTIPGGSSYFVPQGMKVAIEAGLGKSFYTGRDILSAREKDLLPEEQFRANTSEIAKTIGRAMGVSPIKLEFVVNGYTGAMGLAFLHAVSTGIPKGTSPEQATKELSAYPIIGGAFQPNDAGGIINSVYERMNEDIKVKRTYDKLVEEGRMSDAQALLQRRGNEYLEAELANSFKSSMNSLTQAERAVAASDMTADEKNAQLKEIRKIKTGLAIATREISDKTIRLTDFP